MILKIEQLSTLEEALALALIRNECRFMMTNDQHEISQVDQTNWYLQIYTKQSPQSYWVWLLKETRTVSDTIIGYLAAKEEEEAIYITEGLKKNQRSKGAGSFLLQSMLEHDFFKKKPIFADIFNHNDVSISFHKKFGFIKYSIIPFVSEKSS